VPAERLVTAYAREAAEREAIAADEELAQGSGDEPGEYEEVGR
jgi:hypothetical protein